MPWKVRIRPGSPGAAPSLRRTRLTQTRRYCRSSRYSGPHTLVSDVRKPLIVFTPKSLLRAKSARSPIDALTHGSFEEVLDDPVVSDDDAGDVQRVVLASAKVAHEALARRDSEGSPVAVVRVEQLYPWPYDGLAAVLERYPAARELVWLQEEPENMGAWNFVKGRLYEALGDEYTIKRVSRPESGSPATGSHGVHVQEQDLILSAAVTIATDSTS